MPLVRVENLLGPRPHHVVDRIFTIPFEGAPLGPCTALSGALENTGSAYGIRTRDLRLERAVSWATRRMRRVAGDRGFEPRLTDPESVVLPLDESPIHG